MFSRHCQLVTVFAVCCIVFLFLNFTTTDLLSVKHQLLNSEHKSQTLTNKETSKKPPKPLKPQKLPEPKTTHVPTIYEILKEKLGCNDRELYTETNQYGNYWLKRNLFIGRKSKSINCAESITYTTNGDYTFFESLPIVLKKWMAPISFAAYTPGYDLNKTMDSIQYLRNCITEKELIRDYVSFHIFFPNRHMPDYVPSDQDEADEWEYDCKSPAPYLNVKRSQLYKTKANLTYPINVARNIARQSANTYFVFPCDVELIPSAGLVPKFLKMISKNISILHGNNGLRVFPLPVFEVRKDASIPSTKTELKTMLENKTAIPFHAMVCKNCHLVPEQSLWLNKTNKNELSVVAIGKRQGKFRYWEPFYISNNKEPIFDERVTWEGMSNKRIQNFAMCLLDYEYLILHPAFLTHMPGIKYLELKRLASVGIMNHLIKTKIEPEYKILYGKNRRCVT